MNNLDKTEDALHAPPKRGVVMRDDMNARAIKTFLRSQAIPSLKAIMGLPKRFALSRHMDIQPNHELSTNT